MVWRILTSFFLVECLFALSVALVWQTNNVEPHYIHLGTEFMAFISSVSNDLNQIQIKIPHIPQVQDNPAYYIFVNTNPLIAFLNSFIVPVNVLIQIGNVLVDVINVFIELIEFVIIIIGKFVTMRDDIANQTTIENSILYSLVAKNPLPLFGVGGFATC